MTRIAVSHAALALAFASPALCQTYHDDSGTIVPSVVPIMPGIGPMGTAANPEYVQGAFSASFGGFQPSSVGAPIAATASGATGALPTGAVVVASNVGSNVAYCALGTSSSTSQQPIPAGGWFAFTVGSATQMTCLTASGTTTINLVGGSGLPSGAGGGGSGGSGSVPTGSAGSPNASVLSVQGVAGGSVIPENQTQLGGVTLGGASSWGTAPTGNVQGVNAAVISEVGVGSTSAAVPSTAQYAGMNVSGALTGLTGTANGLKVDGSAVTQPVSATTLPLPTGAATAASQPALNGDGGALAHVTNWPALASVAVQAAASGGWTPYLASGLSTTVKTVKSSAGQLGMLQCWNSNSSQVYVQVFNAASVTLGSTTPLLSVPIGPASTGGLALTATGLQFSAAIAIAATTTATGSAAPTTALDCNLGFN
jgi:hypothetical protein